VRFGSWGWGCALPDWRDDIRAAVEVWIKAEGGEDSDQRSRAAGSPVVLVGPARRDPEPGWYAVDLRGKKFDLDRAEGLRLTGPGRPQAGQGFAPLDVIFDGRQLRVHVAEFVDLDEAYLWRQSQPVTYLLTQLRDGLRAIGDAGLAHELVGGRLAEPPDSPKQIAGFSPAQREAYGSCFTPGVRLVWGPPGTGKTRVLSEAISDLAAAGRRVLLASATNIAVDNALAGVLRHGRHRSGDLVRVGPPQLREIADNPSVSLSHLVRGRLTEVEQRREDINRQLLALRKRAADLAAEDAALAGFDPDEHARIRTLIETTDRIPHLAERVSQAAGERERAQTALARAEELVVGAQTDVDDTKETLEASGRIADLERDLAKNQAAADQLRVTALKARADADRVAANLEDAQAGSKFQRWRNRAAIAARQDELAALEAAAETAEQRARDNQELIERVRQTTHSQIGQLRARVRYSDEQIAQRHTALQQARRYRSGVADRYAELDGRHRSATAELAAAEATSRPSAEERAAVDRAIRDDLPARHQRLLAMHAQTAAAEADRQRLEQQYDKTQEEFERLRRNAEAVLIKRAKVVATTLARLRTSKVLLDGPYDVVLIDEVGAATVPEVLLAISRARTTAVLLGDFLQLGAVISPKIKDSDDPAVRRWLCQDVFSLCGITTAAGARAHPGCTTLDIQHRFGPVIMDLANKIAYDGQLRPGDEIRDHEPDDPEIVLIDTDGAGDLSQVRATGPTKGWWPIGALIARILADYHRTREEDVGVVTPYTHQADATLEAFRDREHADTNPTDVGTAHRFQGREFDIVVFDLVEDHLQPRRMATAHPKGAAFDRESLRLFTVAVTRTRHRLYLIGSRTRINNARPGTPLAQLAPLLRANGRTIAARYLANLPDDPRDTRRQTDLLGPVGQELSTILAEHVRVTEIQDERQFYTTFATHLRSAQRTIWMWAPWTANRLKTILPLLAEAADRGVKIVTFVRDPSDNTQGKPNSQQQLASLRTVVPTVIEVHTLHQKIVVIDERVVMLGSLNALSQSHSREVMLVMEGHHFARKLLEHEQARAMANPPPACGRCGSKTIDLRRTKRQSWQWRCYAPTSTPRSDGRRSSCGWTTPLQETRDAL
jgi:hypothetical protein